MSQNLNVVAIVGNLVADPEQKSESFTVCRIAHNRRKKVDGEFVDVPIFLDVVVVGKDAGFVAEYGAKGRQVAVRGELDIDEWEDQEGNKRQKPQIVSFGGVQLLGPKQDGDAPAASASDESDSPF
jgi:single-strand DNA-binding protein